VNKPNSIDHYLDMAPLDQRTELIEIRRLIEKNLDKAKGSIGSAGFPIYTIGKQWKAGFAYRPQGPMVYIIDTDLLNQHEDKFRLIRAGKTSLRYSGSRNLSMGALRQLVIQMLQTLNA